VRTTEAIPNATSIWSRWRERRRTTAAPARASARFAPPLRLHIGCGDKHLDGWVNVDPQALPRVDVVADVTRGLEFRDVDAIYAEHFLEHLPLAAALDFLVEAHRCLRPDAWMRLSTPNLDWVWLTHYRPELPASEKVTMALRANRAFHGWGHQFLWNRELLGAGLSACGFTDVRWCRYGSSEHAVFQGIERHERSGDVESLPHVLIVEAKKGESRDALREELREMVHDEFLAHLDG